MNGYPLSQMQMLDLEENYCKKGGAFMFCDVDGVQFVVPDEIREFTITNLETDQELWKINTIVRKKNISRRNIS